MIKDPDCKYCRALQGGWKTLSDHHVVAYECVLLVLNFTCGRSDYVTSDWQGWGGGARVMSLINEGLICPHCQHQSRLVPHNHTRLLIYAKCVRASGILVLLDDRKPVIQYDFYQTSNSSHLGSHRIIWNLIQIKLKIS
jgi:hypothetical protein